MSRWYSREWFARSREGGYRTGVDRRLASALIWVVLCASTYRPAPVCAGGLKDLEDGWLIPVPLAVDLLATAEEAEFSTPRGGLWLNLGLARLYGLAELPLQHAAVGVAKGRISAGLAWQELGNGLFREQQFRLRLVWGELWRVSAAGGLEQCEVAGEVIRHHAALEIALRSPCNAPVMVQLIWALMPPPPWHATRSQRRWLLLAGRLELTRWAVAVDRSGTGTPSLQADLLFRVGAGFACGLRGELATGSMGLTTTWKLSGFLLRTSHVAHPDLGLTHRWSLAWGALGNLW